MVRREVDTRQGRHVSARTGRQQQQANNLQPPGGSTLNQQKRGCSGGGEIRGKERE